MKSEQSLMPMSSYLTNDKTKLYLQKMLGEKTNDFITSLSSMVGSDAKLNECDRHSLMGCALKSVSMNLPFDQNLGFAWVIPYEITNRETGAKELKAQFQMGYKGYIQLAQRSGQVRQIGAMDVREGEFVGRNMFGEPMIQWLPEDERQKRKIIGYMAGIELVNGFQKVIYWSIEQVLAHAERYSQSYRASLKYKNMSSIWTDSFDKMALKTVIKSLISKYAPLSIEMQSAIKYDQAIVEIDEDTEKENILYVDNVQDEAFADKKITPKQVKEIANLISTDETKKAKLKELGYDEKDIQNIFADDFDKIVSELRG